MTARAADRHLEASRHTNPEPPARHLETAEHATALPPARLERCRDERGDYTLFIAVIAAALLVFGGIAYDAPRLNTARQDALHTANEAARVAAATVASGGTVEQAEQNVQNRLSRSPRVYGQEIRINSIVCSGTRVQVTVQTEYLFRSALALARPRQPIIAAAAAEASLVQPWGTTSLTLEGCPLTS